MGDLKNYSFKDVSVEVEFDTFKQIDLSKDVANAIHRNTNDIGIDDKARELYHNGSVELSADLASSFLLIIMQSDLVAAVKLAIKKLFE